MSLRIIIIIIIIMIEEIILIKKIVFAKCYGTITLKMNFLLKDDRKVHLTTLLSV